MGKKEQGELLKRLREARGKTFTQSELGRRALVSPSHIARVERGERGVSARMVERLAPHLGEDPEAVIRAFGYLPRTDVITLTPREPLRRVLAALRDGPWDDHVKGAVSTLLARTMPVPPWDGTERRRSEAG